MHALGPRLYPAYTHPATTPMPLSFLCVVACVFRTVAAYKALIVRLEYIINMFTQGLELRNGLVRLAEEIARGGAGGLQANERFRSMIAEVGNLDESLEAMALSDTYIFVYATNMIKLMENGDFCSITETRSEENILSLADSPSQKSRNHGRVLTAAVAQLGRDRPRYVEQSLIDLAAVSLKVLLEETSNEAYLQSTLATFLPGYRLNPRLISTTADMPAVPIEARPQAELGNLQGYCLAVRVFTSMFEYVSVQGGKIYYEYRKCIYVFRNSYLPYLLQFGVEHIKALLPLASPQLRPVIALTLSLLEAIFMYPFTLSLHEFELDDDLSENITGVTAGDIYLPNYFRPVVCDEVLLRGLVRYWEMLVRGASGFEQARGQLNSLLRVLGRSTCASQYTFKNDDERLFARNFAQEMIEDLMRGFRFYDSYYLQAVLDIVQKHLTMHDSILLEIKHRLLFPLIAFLQLLIQHSDIAPFEGRRNAFARAFEIAATVADYAKEKLTEERLLAFREQCQGMLELAFQRITGPGTDAIMQKYGQNQPGEIENFTDLYEGLLPLFEAGLERNLGLFEQLDLRALGAGAKIMWLHLCAQLLPKTQANPRQAGIILRYYELARQGNSLAALRYIRTLAEQVLQECSEGVSTTALWRNIQELSNVSFETFMMNVIKTCIANFGNPCGEVVDYSLDFFRSIYSLLRKHDTKAFETYYSIVRELLPQLKTSVFVSPQHFPKRRTFFNVISLIWINGESVDYLYEIHKIIREGLASGTAIAFCMYLHDITGIIEPIDRHESFEVVVDLALADLKALFAQHFKDDKSTALYLADPFFSKIFCRLVLALITDVNRKLYFETHTDIPLRIHQLLFPLVARMARGGEGEVPPQLPVILEKMVALHPLAPLASFRQVVGGLRGLEGFQKLVRAYFEHIQRVEDIGWLYDLIEQNIELMMMWWEEAIFRDMHPNINLRTIAEARIWSSLRQKENLAKLIFEIGYYDKTYWNVSEFRSERDFVTHFGNLYQ